MMIVVCALLALIWLLDGLRLRSRIAALPRLAPSDEPVSPGHRFLGVPLDEATRRAASAHARRENLAVLDLVPADLPAGRGLLFASSVDAQSYRSNDFARGRSAGFALLVDADLLERVPPPAADDPFAWAERLKPYAPGATGFAVAPDLRAPAGDGLDYTRQVLGGALPAVLLFRTALIGLALAGVVVSGVAGALALAAYHLQPILIFAGSALRPRGLGLLVALRAPIDLVNAVHLARRPAGPDPIEERRARYQALAADGTAPFFEPRRDDCPLCGGRSLEVHVQTTDLLQSKPGEFTLERCLACRHIFQNPRLSLAGLDYYYGDFYDGLGERDIDSIFSFKQHSYHARARSVEGHVEPRRWLDVGTGHGHFCWSARSVWPGARFDGLDLSESIEEAHRRRWVDAAYRGLFPELAPRIPDRYDVVSMSHYLEHTREPREELRAAHAVLRDGGALMIEVPDPASRVQWLLGRFWMPWFQPQHLHFLSVENLERLLVEEGFQPVRWQRGEAHQPIDFLFGAVLALRTAFPPDVPWREPRSAPRLHAAITFWAGAPILAAAWLLDRLTAPLFRRIGWSNTYRLVALKAR